MHSDPTIISRASVIGSGILKTAGILRRAIVFITVSFVWSMFIAAPHRAIAGDMTAKNFTGNIIIFTVEHPHPQMMALVNESAGYVGHVFEQLGRFRQVENHRIKRIMGGAGLKPDSADYYQKFAAMLDCDAYCVISVFQQGQTNFAELRFEPMDQSLARFRRRIRVRSKILLNIPLKLGREIAHLHHAMPLRARVLEALPGGRYRINIGEWNGIHKGRYRSARGDIIIKETGRFDSIAEFAGTGPADSERILIEEFPKPDALINRIDERIAENAVSQYGLDREMMKGDDSRKRLLEGICVVNMGGNICLPGYGAFLSTHYLGFENATPAYSGIALTASLTTIQLVLPSIMTDFSINFFPWIRDSDKTERMQNFQIFLWASLPFTFSAAYLDQLAYQFHKYEKLPPFFDDKDIAAASFSLFIPGGGLFYKGYRFGGWGFYLSEMGLLSYGVYMMESGKRGLYAFSAAGIIKIIEIGTAYFIRPSYSFYNLENDREGLRVSLLFDAYRSGTEIAAESRYRCGVSASF